MKNHQTIKPRARVYKVRDPYRNGDRHAVVVYGGGIHTHGTTLDGALKLWREHFHQRHTTGTIPWGNSTND